LTFPGCNVENSTFSQSKAQEGLDATNDLVHFIAKQPNIRSVLASARTDPPNQLFGCRQRHLAQHNATSKTRASGQGENERALTGAETEKTIRATSVREGSLENEEPTSCILSEIVWSFFV
jgi:hypothetical protein